MGVAFGAEQGGSLLESPPEAPSLHGCRCVRDKCARGCVQLLRPPEHHGWLRRFGIRVPRPDPQGDGNSCVEVAISSSRVGVRDSKTPARAFLTFPPEAFAPFLEDLKADAPR